MEVGLVLFMVPVMVVGACAILWRLFRRSWPWRRHRVLRTAPGVHFSGAHDAGVPVDEKAFAEIVRHIETSEAVEPGDNGRN